MQAEKFKAVFKNQFSCWLGLILIGSVSVQLWAQSPDFEDEIFIRIQNVNQDAIDIDIARSRIGNVVVTLPEGSLSDAGDQTDYETPYPAGDQRSFYLLRPSFRDSRPSGGSSSPRVVNVHRGEEYQVEVVGSDLRFLDVRGEELVRIQLSKTPDHPDDPADSGDLGVLVTISRPLK